MSLSCTAGQGSGSSSARTRKMPADKSSARRRRRSPFAFSTCHILPQKQQHYRLNRNLLSDFSSFTNHPSNKLIVRMRSTGAATSGGINFFRGMAGMASWRMPQVKRARATPLFDPCTRSDKTATRILRKWARWPHPKDRILSWCYLAVCRCDASCGSE